MAGRYVAFNDDPAAKAGLLARLDAAAIAGRTRGGPAGAVVTEWDDCATFGKRYGYPPSLVVMLSRIVRSFNTDLKGAGAFARDWFARTHVGADLGPVPGRILVWVLDAVLAGDMTGDGLGERLLALHRAELKLGPVERLEWAALRHDILNAADATSPGSLAAARTGVWEAAAWSATGSRTILSDVAAAWAVLAVASSESDWSADDEARKEAVLHGLAAELASGTGDGGAIDYPRHFRERHPGLEAKYVRHLKVMNERYTSHWRRLGAACVDRLAAASPTDPTTIPPSPIPSASPKDAS